MKPQWSVVTAMVALYCASAAVATPPAYRMSQNGLLLDGVSAANPIVYDNDWWTDVPDAAYIWAKASAGKANLRANIITRCTFGWDKGYAHTMAQQVEDFQKLWRLAQDSGLRNVPNAVLGATEALRRPASGKIEDTNAPPSPGSALIVAEARKARPSKPLLVFVGGSCTTVATAYLTDPSIAARMVLFQVDGGAYNGSDGWAWEICKTRCRFANWARGYFWQDVSKWNPEPFGTLPKNPLCDWLRQYATVGFGKANQWGDGAWLYWLYDHRCLTRAADYDGVAITVPKEGTNAQAMAAEFIATMSDAKVYQARSKRT